MRRSYLLLLCLAVAGCSPGSATEKTTGLPPTAQVVVDGVTYRRIGQAIQEGFPCHPLCAQADLGFAYIRYNADHVRQLADLITTAGAGAIMFDFDSANAEGTMHHWHTIYAPDSAKS